MQIRCRAGGFSLYELIVTMSVFTIVLSLGMPSFGKLPPNERWALVAYIKTMSKVFGHNAKPTEIIEIPKRVPPTAESVELGRVAFENAGCPKCHGTGGRGDGPNSDKLRDKVHNMPLKPPDLAAPFVFIGGESPQDIYRTMMTGMDGTPMPPGSFFFDDDEPWHVVNWILSLSKKPK